MICCLCPPDIILTSWLAGMGSLAQDQRQNFPLQRINTADKLAGSNNGMTRAQKTLSIHGLPSIAVPTTQPPNRSSIGGGAAAVGGKLSEATSYCQPADQELRGTASGGVPPSEPTPAGTRTTNSRTILQQTGEEELPSTGWLLRLVLFRTTRTVISPTNWATL